MSRLIRSAGAVLLLLAVACEGPVAPDLEPGAIGERSSSSNVTPVDLTGNGPIVFSSFRDGPAQIYIMNPDGSNLALLKAAPTALLELSYPVWSPDGTKIAYIQNGETVYVMNADGTGEVELTNDRHRKAYLTWSPDGTRLAWSDARTGIPGEGITVMNADGSGEVRIFVSTENIGKLTWSPDGSKIAFMMVTDVASIIGEIFVINADGTGLAQLTSDGGLNLDPAWSPDGSTIAFVSSVGLPSPSLGPVLAVMNADGTGRRLLAPAQNAFDSHPAWSPDGRMIVFSRSLDHDAGHVGGLHVIRSDGTGMVQLTDVGGGSPSWGPRRLTTMADCTNGEWMKFGFPNQGQCIKFLNRP